MKSGYSPATLNANIAALMKAGHERNEAIFAAASEARKCYFRRFPRGALPRRLAFPKAHLLAQYYDSGGRPLKANPVAGEYARGLEQATRLYKGFTGVAPKTLRKTAFNPAVRVALAIGRVFGIMYEVDATGERFHHEFKGKARPLLTVSADGHQVFLRGGAFTFTKRGFVDRK